MAVKWFNYREMKLFYIFFQSICKREGFRQSRIDGVDTFHIIFRYMICVFYGRYHFTKMLYYAIQSIFDFKSQFSVNNSLFFLNLTYCAELRFLRCF